MYRGALIVSICVGSCAAQTVSCRYPNVLAFCDQAIVSYWGQNEGVSPPVALMQCGQPEYTEEARIAHLAGFVTMALTVDDEGVPNQIRVLRPLGLGLDESAVTCMRQSRYSPAQKDGKPVPLSMSVSLPFDQHWNSDWHLGAASFQTTTGCARPVVTKAQYPAPRATTAAPQCVCTSLSARMARRAT